MFWKKRGWGAIRGKTKAQGICRASKRGRPSEVTTEATTRTEAEVRVATVKDRHCHHFEKQAKVPSIRIKSVNVYLFFAAND